MCNANGCLVDLTREIISQHLGVEPDNSRPLKYGPVVMAASSVRRHRQQQQHMDEVIRRRASSGEAGV